MSVTEFQICICVPNFIKIGWFSAEIWLFYDLQYWGRPPSWILKFRYYIKRPLSPCYSASLCKISLKLDDQLQVMAKKRFLKWQPSAFWNFKNFRIWSCNCHRVPNLHLCTKFHQNRLLFRWDIAISRFTRWRLCGILNFSCATMSSLKSQCWTFYRLSIEIVALNCLLFEKFAFFVGDRQTDEQMERKMRKGALALASGALIMV